jgi:hypothetical protein
MPLDRRARTARSRTPPRTSQPPPPEPVDAPIDEVVDPVAIPTADQLADGHQRDVFVALEAEHRRMREAAAHEVLGVGWHATVAEIRRGYFRLTKLYHPDVYAKHGSAAVRHLAQEVFIHINKAYDRMREAAAAAGDAIIAGPALLAHTGWIVGFEDVVEAPRAAAAKGTAPQAAVGARPGRSVAVPPGPGPGPGPDPGFGTPQTAVATPGHVASGGPGPGPGPGVALVAAAPTTYVDTRRTRESISPDAPPGGGDGDLFAAGTPAPAQRERRLTEDNLFGDIELTAEGEVPAGSRATASGLFSTAEVAAGIRRHAEAVIADARDLMSRELHDDARVRLAEALHRDPRNRPLRALYHVANGHCLVAAGRKTEATTQFETALVHDRDCVEARDALATLTGPAGEPPRKRSWWRRLFGL